MSRNLLALALGLVILPGCATSTLQCRLDAIESAMPTDPGLVTVDDIVTVIHKLEACKAAPPTDAGAPK